MDNEKPLNSNMVKQNLNLTDSKGALPTDGFFAHQREQIWNASLSETPSSIRVNGIHSPWVGYAAAFITLLIGFIAFFVTTTDETTCATFYCLWEKTNKNDIYLTDSELNQWLNDDQLFFELTESF